MSKWTWFVANDVINDLAVLAGFSMDYYDGRTTTTMDVLLFSMDVLLTAFFLNNLTSTGQSNYIHSTYVAHQTAKRCFDSS